MELGAITNPDAVQYGKPLEGVRILALEQMQALPYARNSSRASGLMS